MTLLTFSKQSCIDQIEEIILSSINNGLTNLCVSMSTSCSVNIPKNSITTDLLTNDLVPEIEAYGYFTDLTDDGSTYTLVISLISLA